MTLSIRKCFFTLFTLFTLLSCRAQQTQVITSLDSSNYFVKLANGFNALLSVRPQTNNITIKYYVKIGPVYERDSTRGISYLLYKILVAKIESHLNNAQNKISNQNTSFNSFITSELTGYELSTSPANYLACLQLLRDSLNFSDIYEKEINSKKEEIKAGVESQAGNYQSVYDSRMIQGLFRKDASKQIIKGDTSMFSFIDLGLVREFYTKYYVPNNVLMNVFGSFDPLAFQTDMGDIFKEVHKGKFDPQLVTKVVDFKPMVYNTRFTVISPVQQPEIQICWLFPGARSNVKSSYYGWLLTTMLNDPNNFIQIKAKKMGCKKLTAVYEPENFSGLLKITMQPDKNNFYQLYNFIHDEMQQLDKTLLNETMMNAAKLTFKTQFKNVKKSKEYPTYITKYWVYNEETYFPSLSDSVFHLKLHDMRKFIIEYLNQSPHITGVMINDADQKEVKADSLFLDLDESINNYAFTYRRNVPELEGAENWAKMNYVLQWLIENPDLDIQVNGMADKKEYNRFRDDSITMFIDSIPTFEQVKMEIVKTGTYRLEMLRALKIAAYLYYHGIDPMRLKGTSMTFSSKTKQEEQDNMKCTLTIDKIKKAPSLYEYHYGHPKPPDSEMKKK